MKKSIYLDNASSTPMLEEVKLALLNAAEESYANASSIHTAGVSANKKTEAARSTIASSLQTTAEEIYFTSGGTESNNWAIQSIVASNTNSKKNKIITSAIEHPSVLAPLEWLAKKYSLQIIKIKTDPQGILSLEELDRNLDENVLLCSLMHVNNETGCVQPIEKASDLCLKHKVPLHVDACQSYMKIPLSLEETQITYLTINAHKVHGPKGIGALYMKKGFELPPLLHGGGHELNKRSGTLNNPGIIAFAKAVELQSKASLVAQLNNLQKYLLDQLRSNFKNCIIAGDDKNRAPHILNVRFNGFSAKDVFWSLNKLGISVSTSSACHSRKNTPSYVLKAMGLSDEACMEALRISLGGQNTKDDMDVLIDALKEIIK